MKTATRNKQFTLEKFSLRRLDVGIMKTQIAHIVRRALGGNRGNVWSAVRIGTPVADHQISNNQSDGYQYTCSISFARTGRKASPEVIERQWGIIQEMAENAGRSKGWTIAGRGEAESPKPEALHA